MWKRTPRPQRMKEQSPAFGITVSLFPSSDWGSQLARLLPVRGSLYQAGELPSLRNRPREFYCYQQAT